jgi:Tol biopolymer transport system component
MNVWRSRNLVVLMLLMLFAGVIAVLDAQAPKSYFLDHPLSEPRIFAEGVISTGDHESHAAFSPDGSTLFFVKMAPDFSKWTIFVSHFKDGKWSEPEIAPFSGQYWDADPFFTKDGNTLYFISNRPIQESDPQKSDMDIWKIEKTKDGWSKPIRMESPINSESSEYYPTVSEHGTLAFGSRRKGGKGASDIYLSRWVNGKYQTAENIGDSINTAGNEFEPFIAPDEAYIIFMATPSEHLEEGDLYMSYNRSGQWTKAVKLPAPFSSDAIEFSPKVSPDGKYFFFSSSRNKNGMTFSKAETTSDMNRRIREAGNGLLDIYQVDFSALQNALKH